MIATLDRADVDGHRSRSTLAWDAAVDWRVMTTD